jgi:Protein of unknown function (DUF3108)
MLSGERKPMQLRRWKALSTLGLATLALHASVLDGMAWSWRKPAVPPNAAALQVRTITRESVVLSVPAVEPAPRPVAKRTAPRVSSPVAPRIETPPPEPRPPPQTPTLEVAAPLAEAVLTPPAPPEPAASELVAAAVPASTPIPVAASASAPQVPADRAQVPPDITISYDLRRGLLRGSAELRWEGRDGQYTLSFDATVAGFGFLQQASTGEFDDTGLAPLRFTDQRAGREVRATNFQREAGKITFSGPSVEFPLVAGTQDRLSLLVQLAAIVSADPRRREPGGQVVMAVVGVRGDLSTWVFRYVGDETVDTGQGPAKAAKFVRERPDAYDTNLEVWLDPARFHLPVRAVQRAGPDDDGLELRLRQATGQP